MIDATNPIADAPPVDGVIQFFAGGSARHGIRRRRASDRTALATLVHPGIQAELVDACVQGGVEVSAASIPCRGGSALYSVRSALIGDNLAARAAGMIAAPNAHKASAPHATASASGSQNVTP